MKYNLENIPLIKSVTQISLTQPQIDTLFLGKNEFFKQRVLEKINNINVYKIKYISQNHVVVGFIAEPKTPGIYPCIIVNRGGSKDFGKLEPESFFKPFSYAGNLATWGYIAITTQYSGNDGGEGKDEFGGTELEDVLNLKIILDNYKNADSTKIGMLGASRGGMMTYLALAKTNYLKAAVSIAGVSDLFEGFKLRPDHKTWVADMFNVENELEIKKRSAIYWVDKFNKTTPLLLMHGTSDWRVSVLNSIELSKKLVEHKVPFKMILFEGADHIITEFKQESYNNIKRWFDKYVKNGEDLPNLELHGD